MRNFSARRVTSRCPLLGVFLFLWASAVTSAEASPEKTKSITTSPSKAVLSAHLDPLLRVEWSRGGLLAEWVQKNRWFQELKGDLLGLGLSREFGRTWLSLPDQEGPGVGAWRGVFLDHVFGTLLKEAPGSILFFESPALIASWALVVPEFKGAEFGEWTTLLKRLSTGGEFSAQDPTSQTSYEGKFLSLRGRKIAWVQGKGCSALSLDPLLAVRAIERCRPSMKVSASEVGVQLQLDQFYPATRTVRKKIVGLQSDARILWQWNSQKASFDVLGGELATDPTVADGALGNLPLEPSFLKALPAGVLHFSGVALRSPNGFNFSLKSLHQWLQQKPGTPAPSRDRVVQGVLAHLGYREKKALSVLLISQPLTPTLSSASASLVNFASGLKGVFSSQKHPLGIRAICKGTLWAVSPVPAALDEVEQTCDGKRPALGVAAAVEKIALSRAPFSVTAYANPGTILIQRFLLGLNDLKTEISDPSVFDASRDLLSRIPKVWLRGSYEAGKKFVALKAAE